MHRAQQGYSYHEVLSEMKRRFEGERLLDKEEARRRFKEGVQKLNRAFRFSARFCDLLDGEKLSRHDLHQMTGIPERDCLLEVLLDPVSCDKKRKRSLRNNEEVDNFYPGYDIAAQK